MRPEGRLILPGVKLNGGCQPDKFDWIKFEQPWAARRAKPMDGWSNGELQEVIRNGMDAGSNLFFCCHPELLCEGSYLLDCSHPDPYPSLIIGP